MNEEGGGFGEGDGGGEVAVGDGFIREVGVDWEAADEVVGEDAWSGDGGDVFSDC